MEIRSYKIIIVNVILFVKAFGANQLLSTLKMTKKQRLQGKIWTGLNTVCLRGQI